MALSDLRAAHHLHSGADGLAARRTLGSVLSRLTAMTLLLVASHKLQFLHFVILLGARLRFPIQLRQIHDFS